MKRIRLRIAYDGTNYCGWQRQDNALTVEEKLQEALDGLFYKGIEILGASRTDSGVHALGNVAVFDVETRIPAEKIGIALNHQLPDDIRIMQSDEVSAMFHPRYCNSRKTYEYTITHTDTEIPTRSRTSYHVYRPLDLGMMRECGKYLEGEHDFSAFCTAGAQVQSKVRRVYSVEIRRNELPVTGGEEIVIRVQGNGFLYNMVRIIAGTLIEVGMGRRSIETVKEAIETGERILAGPTAPAKGLTLVRIDYDE